MLHRVHGIVLLPLALAPVLGLAGCATGSLSISGRESGDGGRSIPDDPDAPPPWTLTIDTSATSPFLAADATSATIVGRVVASAGLRTLEVGGLEVPAPGGTFRAVVPVVPGLVHVPIEATDAAMPSHTRRGDRALIVADYLPEGMLDARAASLVLTSEIVEPMADPLRDRVAAIDVASEIRRRPTLTDDECRTRPTGASHAPPRLRVFVDEMGQLVLEIVVPSLRVTFDGECRTFLFTTAIEGQMSTDVVLRTALYAPLADDCITGLEHGPVEVALLDFDLDVRGGSGLSGLLVGLAAELREGESAETLRNEFAAQAEALLDAELAMVSVFDETATRTMFGIDMDVSLCLTGLVTESGMLRAIVGSRVVGPGLAEAPGAPLVAGTLPPAMASTLTLDANLVSQLVFSAWRAGALTQNGVMQVPISTLALVAPRLRTQYPSTTMVTVDLDGGLPPIVRAAPIATDPAMEASTAGDLLLEVGDLDLVLRVGDEVLFRVGNILRFTLELVPEAGGLRPEVLDVQATTWVEDEPVVDGNDAALAAAIGARIGDAAGELLGAAAIELPSLGGTAFVATDVVADPGGRYVHLRLAP